MTVTGHLGNLVSLPFGSGTLLSFRGIFWPSLMCLVNLLVYILLGLQLSYPRGGKHMTWVSPSDSPPGSLVFSGKWQLELSHSSFICEILTKILGTVLFLSFLRTARSDLPSVLGHYPMFCCPNKLLLLFIFYSQFQLLTIKEPDHIQSLSTFLSIHGLYCPLFHCPKVERTASSF